VSVAQETAIALGLLLLLLADIFVIAGMTP